MQKIIFVGGPSGVGKTTFAKNVAELYNGKYLHFFKYFHSFFGKPDKEHYYRSLRQFIHVMRMALLTEKRDIFIDIHYALQLDSLYCWNKRSVDVKEKFYPSLEKECIKTLERYFDVYAILLLTGYENLKGLGITKEQFQKELESETEEYLKLPLENERKLMILRADINFMAQLLQYYILGKTMENRTI